MTYLFKRTVYDCKQATLLSLKKEQGEISLMERLKLTYHLYYCGPCRRFIEQSRRINAIGRTFRQMLDSRAPFVLSDATKAKLQHQVDQLGR